TDMSATGLGIAGLDVSLAAATDALTGSVGTAASHNGTVGVAGVATVGAANSYLLAESFDKLNGTVTVGGKSLDLSSVKFAAGSTAAQRTTAIQTALTGAGVGATVANTATGLTFTTAAPTSVADVPNKTIAFS